MALGAASGLFFVPFSVFFEVSRCARVQIFVRVSACVRLSVYTTRYRVDTQ
jgi:hypothetical protein